MQKLKSLILELTEANQIEGEELIQSLWSGYGSLKRYHLSASDHLTSIIIKEIDSHQVSLNEHPQGWSGQHSHNRKVKSYEVEQIWYRDFVPKIPSLIKVPRCLKCVEIEGINYIFMEDLKLAGYPRIIDSPTRSIIRSGLKWLAHFHAFHLKVEPQGLWSSGTYWHLATRLDELEVLKSEDQQLADAALFIDQALRECPYQTIVHGDAKLANFCFSEDDEAAGVDFQYVGRGIGVQDVAYFLGSCLTESELEAQHEELLNYYFKELIHSEHSPWGVDLEQVELSWRKLYPYAMADFHRFLKGWSPGHWKVNTYTERMCRQVIHEYLRS